MVTVDEIRDEASLEAWLEGQSREDAVQIAVRSALRVAPLAWARPAGGEREDDLTSLPVWRALLIGGVAGIRPTPPIRAAAAAAVYYVGISGAGAAAGHAAAAAACAVAAAVRAAADAVRAAADAVRAAADAVRAATADAAQIWEQARDDARRLDAGADPFDSPLWSIPQPDWFGAADTAMRARWAADPAGIGDFWLRWWDGVLSGRQIDWALQEKVALIPDEVWKQGAEAVAAEIARIEAELYGLPGANPDLDGALASLGAGAPAAVANARRAFLAYRAELPPTFDAVLGLITLEVERLQSRNYRDDEDVEEAKRQIGVLTTLYQAVAALKALVPEKAEMSDDDAEKAEKLSRLYVRKFQEWPRANVDELVDSTCRFALVGVTTAMLPMIGVTTPYAFAAGLVMFGGKKMAEAVKMAKDAIKP